MDAFGRNGVGGGGGGGQLIGHTCLFSGMKELRRERDAICGRRDKIIVAVGHTTCLFSGMLTPHPPNIKLG